MSTFDKKTFFGIRTDLPLWQKTILGIIPFVFFLILWFYLTMGNSAVIKLPMGVFEAEKEKTPKAGVNFHRSVPLVIDNSKLIYKGEASGLYAQSQTLLSVGSDTIDISAFPAIDREGSIQVTLPAGYVVGVTPDNKYFEYKFEVLESRILAPVILPSPYEVCRSFPQLWVHRKLLNNLFYSFLRVASGYVLALCIVFPISLLMGTFSFARALLSPIVVFCRYLPISALAPLTMSFFGINETQKIVFLALGFIIFMLPLFINAVDDVDNVYLQAGYTIGANKIQTIRRIILPVAMPSIYDAMRIGFGVGWGYIILAEMLDMGEKGGVGALIITSQRVGPKEDIYIILISIIIFAFFTNKIWEIVGDILFPYRSRKR